MGDYVSDRLIQLITTGSAVITYSIEGVHTKFTGQI